MKVRKLKLIQVWESCKKPHILLQSKERPLNWIGKTDLDKLSNEKQKILPPLIWRFIIFYFFKIGYIPHSQRHMNF